MGAIITLTTDFGQADGYVGAVKSRTNPDDRPSQILMMLADGPRVFPISDFGVMTVRESHL